MQLTTLSIFEWAFRVELEKESIGARRWSAPPSGTLNRWVQTSFYAKAKQGPI